MKLFIRLKHGILCFALMRFGLKNSVWTFQWTMNVLLTNVVRQLALVDLDGTLIYSWTPHNPTSHAREVLVTLYVARRWGQWTGRTAKSITNRKNYHGQVFHPGRLQLSHHTIEAILKTRTAVDHDGTLVIIGFIQLLSPLCVKFCPFCRTVQEMASKKSIADLWQNSRRLNYRLGDDKSETSGNPCVGNSTFPRWLYCRHKLLWQAHWLHPGREQPDGTDQKFG